jgi:hypothetical protein
MKRLLFVLPFFLFVFVGCDEPNPNPSTNVKLSNNPSRIEVISAQKFTDSRFYERDIMVLRDKQTGKEYLAVMGAGVVDMYPSGKTHVED